MKLVRFFSKCILVVCLFVLGVSAADKEYLRESIIRVQIIGSGCEDLKDYFRCIDVNSAEELCQKVKAYNTDLDVYIKQEYFEASIQDDILLPGGMYTTVFVKMDSGQMPVGCFTKSIAPVNTRFYIEEEPIMAYVQNSYVSFLSFLGMAEKLVINFQDGL